MAAAQGIELGIMIRGEVREAGDEAVDAEGKIVGKLAGTGWKNTRGAEENEVVGRESGIAQRELLEGLAQLAPDIVGWHRGDGVGDFHAVANHLAEDGEAAVLFVEIGGVVGEIDEPLIG
jgi:hypothetical protein